MTKEIAKANNKPFFSLREGSNYKVMMTYDRSEVVEFEQFKKLMQQLNDTEIKFLTMPVSSITLRIKSPGVLLESEFSDSFWIFS